MLTFMAPAGFLLNPFIHKTGYLDGLSAHDKAETKRGLKAVIKMFHPESSTLRIKCLDEYTAFVNEEVIQDDDATEAAKSPKLRPATWWQNFGEFLFFVCLLLFLLCSINFCASHHHN